MIWPDNYKSVNMGILNKWRLSLTFCGTAIQNDMPAPFEWRKYETWPAVRFLPQCRGDLVGTQRCVLTPRFQVTELLPIIIRMFL